MMNSTMRPIFFLVFLCVLSTWNKLVQGTGQTMPDQEISSECRTEHLKNTVIFNCSTILKGHNQFGLILLPDRVVILDLSFNNLIDLPVFAHYERFKSVVEVHLNDNNLNTVAVNEFLRKLRQAKLEVIDLSGNNIDQIPTSIESVQNLNLCNNKLVIIDGANFAEWRKLKTLNLRGNQIEKIEGQCDVNSKLILNWLDLSKNNIQKIKRESFCQCISLKHLNISYNRIEFLHEESFPLLQLDTLDLSNNLLSNIPVNLFKKCAELKYLDLSNNRLFTLPSNLPMMEWFDVSYNRIKTVSESFSTILYPQTVFLLGGNPFLCDCDMLWLKEFFDTRSYLLNFVNHLNRTRFIPFCAEPKNMAGKSWEFLTEDLFQCQQLVEKDLELTNQKIEDILQDQQDAFVEADLTGCDFILVSVNLMSVVKYTSIVLQYHKFGDRQSKKEFVFPPSVSSYRIKGLEANTPYIVCLLSKTTETDHHEHNCIEVMTLPRSKYYFESFREHSILICIFACVFVTVIVCVMSLSKARSHVSTKAKRD